MEVQYCEKFCRICFRININLVDFSDLTDINKLLNEVCPVYDSVPKDPVMYLCNDCYEKLKITHEFLILLNKSNEYYNNSDTIILENHDDNNDNNNNSDDNNDNTIVPLIIKRRKRSKIVSPEIVEQLINENLNKSINTNNLICHLCGFKSLNQRSLSVHMSHVHKEFKDKFCILCNCEIDGSLNDHNNDYHLDELKFKCVICKREFKKRYHFIDHLRNHSSYRPYKCDHCNSDFVSQTTLKQHLLRSHNINGNDKIKKPIIKYNCPHCIKKFNQIYGLKHHLKISKIFACIYCKLIFSTFEQQQNHQCDKQKLNLLKRNFCKLCNKRVRSLNEHMKIHHTNNTNNSEKNLDNNFLCNLCGKQFKTSTKLRIHLRTHTGELPYKCKYCDKKMSSRTQVVVHERIHTGEKPHICNICGKGFAQSSVLNIHMRLHTGRPELCTICSKRFCRRTELIIHMRQHTGEKPYKCNLCIKSFKQNSHLMEHLKIHSDERPYICDYCNKSFKASSTLKTHIRIHLNDKPFKCNLCKYASRQSYTLKQHKKLIHNLQ